MACYLADVLYKLTGSDYSQIVSDAVKTGDFSAPEMKKATQLIQSVTNGTATIDDFLSTIMKKIYSNKLVILSLVLHDTTLRVALKNSFFLAIGFIFIQHSLALITAAVLDKNTAIWAVLIVLIWHGFGWGMLIYYTGIKNIDPVLYEAAAIDGANQVTTFLKITLPLMKPVIKVNVAMAVISALKQMETVYLLTNGGPGNST